MIVVPVDRMAHGGAAVGRVDSRVVFVRGAIPGETVRARVTREGRRGRYLEADTVEVLVPSPDRVTPPCALAGACGGCDWQHIALPRQRLLKQEVVTDQMQRLGGTQVDLTVEPAGDDDGLRWRTRMRFAASPEGSWGLRRAASRDVVPVSECPIAVDSIDGALRTAPDPAAGDELVVVAQPGRPVEQVLPDGSPAWVEESAGGRTWRLSATGFWQAHRNGPRILLAAVAPHVTDATVWWDLYSGVGLFAGALASSDQRVTAVEGDRSAAATARTCLADLPQVSVVHADVRSWVGSAHGQPDVVVLDPPRAGAGAAVCQALTATSATALVYVSCDPATLARDTRSLLADGWELTQLSGFDLFPMTHHVECVAVFRR